MQQLIEIIKKTPTESLREVNKLQNIIKELGLFFPDKALHIPKSYWGFCDRGLQIWQSPEQLADYLVYLSTKPIKSYLEIGCGAGGTFITTVEYLERFNGPIESFAIDSYDSKITKSKSKVIKEYIKINKKAKLIIDKSTSIFKHIQPRSFDLIMIDADHSYQGVKKDWDYYKNYSNTIAFHDIRTCPGVSICWQLIKQQTQGKYTEFCRIPEKDFHEHSINTTGTNYLRIFGIGLIEKWGHST
jgi:hypothetical protein